MKKILSVFVCFILIISICSVPSSAIAIEIIGSSYAAYAILAAALAAAGYTVATSDVSPEIFQGILDSPNAELVKALISGTSLYLTAKGQVYFNWTASEWHTFVDWVIASNIASGSLVLTGHNLSADILNYSNWDGYTISNYYETYIRTTTGEIGYQLANGTIVTWTQGNGAYQGKISFSNGYQTFGNWTTMTNVVPCYLFGSPVLNNGGKPLLSIGIGVANASGTQIAHTQGDIVGVKPYIQGNLGAIIFSFSNLTWNVRLKNNCINLYNSTYSNGINITGTSLFTDTYDSVISWFSDCIGTGSYVGDFTGLGSDVINPGRDIEVGIDAYPDNQVGVGADSVPDVIDGTIDIPLDRYIDTPIDLSQDPVPIDFTPWQDKTIDTVPDDVIPDVKINPTTDIPNNPDIPWADTESYPIDYPTDTTTSDLPSDPNPNTPPDGDEANKLKLLPLVLSKFPFCLPWDLYHGVNSFFVSAEAPVFDIPLRSQSSGINETIHIDFNNYQTLANVSRWFFSALWVIILIMVTRKIIWK